MCRSAVHAVTTNAGRNVCARRWIERELIMELDGDEKRIQALFSELAVADQIRVPQFGHMWTRAQVSKESRGMGRPVAVLVSLLLTAAACSLAVWTWYRSAEAPILAVQLPAEATYTPTPILVDPATRDSRRPKHIALRRQVDRSISTEVTLLLSWQSKCCDRLVVDVQC